MLMALMNLPLVSLMCGLVQVTNSDVMMADVSQQHGSVMVIMTVGI